MSKHVEYLSFKFEFDIFKTGALRTELRRDAVRTSLMKTTKIQSLIAKIYAIIQILMITLYGVLRCWYDVFKNTPLESECDAWNHLHATKRKNTTNIRSMEH